MTTRSQYYIGLISEASLNGVSGILARIDTREIEILSHAHPPYPETLQHTFVAQLAPAKYEIERSQQKVCERPNICPGPPCKAHTILA